MKLLKYLIITFFNFLFTEIERSKVRNAFAQYLSPVMVSKLAESSESLVLGGERKEMTVLFSDIRGFTAISEKYKIKITIKSPNGKKSTIKKSS